MKTPSIIFTAAIVGLLALALVACEDTDVTAPSDGAINVIANPATIVLNPSQGITSGTSQISATVFGSDGKALQGASVQFAVSGGGGTLDPTSATTNSSGTARSTYRVTSDDPPSAVVTAQSGAISDTVDLTVTETAANQPPTAAIVMAPTGGQEMGGQQLGRPVLFDGSFSTDPEDDAITCYQWSIDASIRNPQSQVPGDADQYDEIVQGPAMSVFERTYDDEVLLNVILRISDDPNVSADCQGTLPPVDQNRLSPFVGTIDAYPINCVNDPPMANAGSDKNILPGSVILDGTLSRDPDGSIETYKWDCGTAFPPTNVSPNGSIVQCTYQAVGTYVATLTVIDDGNGMPDPGSSQAFQCEKSSTDEVVVTVAVP